MSSRIFIILSCALLISSCAAEKVNPNIYSNVGKNQNAQIKLAEAAVSVSNSLDQLAEIEYATHPHAKLPPPPSADQLHMAQLSSITWTGPIEPLMKKIALASHYRLRVMGNRPAIPIIVEITATHTPLANILRDVKFQAQKKAAIKVYPRRRVIELRYLSG